MIDAAEVCRLHAAKLTAGQIAHVMQIPLAEVKAVLHAESQRRAEQNYQMRQAAKETPPPPPIPWEFARGKDEPPVNYARRVLKAAGGLPNVSLTPAETIRRANVALKARGYPQIADRPEWPV